MELDQENVNDTRNILEGETMGYQAYKIFKFEVEVKVRPDEGIFEAIKKLNNGEWENND